MFGIKIFVIADHEKGLLFRKDCFEKVLLPGSYCFIDLLNSIRLEKQDCTYAKFYHPRAKFLLRTYSELTQDHFVDYEISENQVGVCYVDDKLSEILPPGSHHVYWRGPAQVRVELTDISEEYQLSARSLSVLMHREHFRHDIISAQVIYYAEVSDQAVGLLMVNGHTVKILPTGSYGFWQYNRNICIKQIDLKLQSIDVSGQEMLSKDRVSLRLNLSAAYRVIDPEKVSMQLKDYSDFIYREFQLALREAVGEKTLDQLLEDKLFLNRSVYNRVAETVSAYGLQVESVGVKDIILPGDMKAILNQVVEAEKVAEANLIKCRQETAATRSLHNTAKVMEGNPTLMRLKELEVLEKVTEKIDNITVYDGLQGVLKNLVSIPVSKDSTVS